MNKKIRILHVAQSAGGVDRYLQMLLKYLDKNEYESILICSKDFQYKDYEYLLVGFEVLDIHREIGINDIKIVCELRQLIRKYKPDIVYAHSSKAGAVTRIANIGIKNVCIYNAHGWAFNMRCGKIKQYIYVIIERIAALFCDKIICISDFERESAIERKICSMNKMQVIYNGVDIGAYEKNEYVRVSKKELNIPEDAFVIGMVGRISYQKAPDIFIKAAVKIKEVIHNAFFIIVGDGEQKEMILKHSLENGLSDSLIVTGWVDNPMSYIELFDVATLLSRWEGFGLVLAEYMLAKKPIVATKVDAIPNIINDYDNGILINVDNVEEVVKAIIYLWKDDKKRHELAQKGYICVKSKYDALRVAKETEKIIRELLKNKNDDKKQHKLL